MQDIKKWFGRWDALHLLYDASRDPNVNEAFLQRQCIIAWETLGGSRFIHYTTHVAPNYKAIFFSERGSRTHPYMLEPIPLSAIRTIASIRLSSHSLRCEIGRWVAERSFIDYALYVPSKFKSLRTTPYLSAQLLLTLEFAFPTFSAMGSPFTHFSPNHDAVSLFRRSFLQFLSIESHLSAPKTPHDVSFGPIGHI
ncbi:hypothetical protein L7F22_057067 [Adiantum nelumboides]|nr:hypothetical protein [Adiantum nelumboides]